MVKSNCCDKNKGDMPSVSKLISNAAETLAHMVRNFVHVGTVAASDEVVKKRETICSPCERRRGDRCAECGCFIQLKIAIDASKCPKGRW